MLYFDKDNNLFYKTYCTACMGSGYSYDAVDGFDVEGKKNTYQYTTKGAEDFKNGTSTKVTVTTTDPSRHVNGSFEKKLCAVCNNVVGSGPLYWDEENYVFTKPVKNKVEEITRVVTPVTSTKTPPSTEITNLDEFFKNNKDKPTAGIGSMAPGFTQADVNGKPVSLSSFKGKYVLLCFWASWSEPSIKDNINVVKAYNSFNQKNFEIISVSLDGAVQKDKWIKAIQDQHLTWTQLCDFKGWNNEVAQLYKVFAVPMNFLLDPNGKIIATNLRGELLNSTLLKILK